MSDPLPTVTLTIEEQEEVGMLIDCDTCAVRDLQCGDCVMTVMLAAPRRPVEINADEQAALSALADGGLLPPLRLVPTSAAPVASATSSKGARGLRNAAG